jgi:hypothetical protein
MSRRSSQLQKDPPVKTAQALTAMRAVLMFALVCAPCATTAWAQKPSTDPKSSGDTGLHGITADQLRLVRGVSASVLAARGSGSSAPAASSALLNTLRLTLDNAIASEFREPLRITAASPGAAAARPVDLPVTSSAAVHRDLQELAGRLRVGDAALSSPVTSAESVQMSPMRSALAAQRSAVMTKWAERIDSALGKEGPERIRLLMDLRNDLRSQRRLDMDDSNAVSTPTLLARPASSSAAPDAFGASRRIDRARGTVTP